MEKNLTNLFDEHMLHKRKIYLWGEINDRSTQQILYRLRYLSDISHENIYLYIHSQGGDTEGADAIIDEIQGLIARGITVETIGLGKAQSAGCCILAMGSPGRRFASPSCSLMLHPVSYEFSQDYVDQQERFATFAKKKGDELLKRVAIAAGKGTGKKLAKFKLDIDKGLWLTTQEAIKYGVIDDVWKYQWEDDINSETQAKSGDKPTD